MRQVGWRLAGVLTVAFLAYAGAASATYLWDRDETRFSRAAVEMVRGGDWIVPHFNDEPRLHKPVLIYWLMAGPYQLLGLHELAFRLPSIVGIVGTGWLTFRIGRRLFDERIALLATGLFLTALLPMVMGVMATADGVLMFCMTLAAWAIIDMLTRRTTLGNALLLTVALGLGQLTKGPVALLPLLWLVGMAGFGRGGRLRVTRGVWLAAAVALVGSLVMFAAWGLPANAATDGAFLREGIGKHVIGRSTQAMESHGGRGWAYFLTLPVYLLVLVVGVYPWTIYLPAGLRAMVTRDVGDARVRAILWGWTLPTLLVFTLVATKLPHYVLSMWPGLMILTAATVVRGSGLTQGNQVALRRGGHWLLPVAGVFTAGLLALPWVLPGGGLTWHVVPAAAVAMGGALGMHRLAQRHQHAQAVAVGVVATLLFWAMALLLIDPAVERGIKVAPRAMAAIRAHVSPEYARDFTLSHAGYDEPSLMFYADREPGNPLVAIAPDDVPAWTQQTGPRALLISHDLWEQARSRSPDIEQRVRIVERIDLLNASSRMRRLELLVVLPADQGLR